MRPNTLFLQTNHHLCVAQEVNIEVDMILSAEDGDV